MIITQTQKRRTFVGAADDGSDLIEVIKGICVDNTIFCGTFSVVGYLSDVKTRRLDSSHARFLDPVSHTGTFHAIAVSGNISLADRQTIVHCHALGALDLGGGRAEIISGELVSARVVSIEFTLDTMDDIRLYRSSDPRTGLDPWRHVEFGEGPLKAPDDRIIPLLEPHTAPPAPPAPPTAAKAAAFAPDEPSTAHELEISDGDILNHPTLGRCEIVSTSDEERLSIRLESGRVVELHLGLIELAPVRREGSKRVYKATIKRRR